MERLAALVPPPRANLVRYHGLFSPNCKVRREIVPKPTIPELEAKKTELTTKPMETMGAVRQKRERMRWAEMLKRVFDIDVMICDVCGGKMEQIAVIDDPDVAAKILDAMCLPSQAPPLNEKIKQGPPWSFHGYEHLVPSNLL